MAQGRGNAVVFAVAVLALMQVVASKDYFVGDANGWTYPSGQSYDTWAAQQKFVPGDNLVFNYGVGQHDVQVVSASEEAACFSSTGKKYTSGADSIPLTKAGDYYFLCSFPGHCEQGMKMKLTVKAAAATPPATPPVEASPPPMATPPPVETPTTPPATPPVVAPAPAPVVQAPAPAPVIAPVPSPVPVPAPVPEVAPTPVPVVSPTPDVVIPTTPAAAPAPAVSSSHSVRVCLSFVGAAIVAAFGALLI